VALAAALGADYCEIFTDVDGVFTADPRIVPAARRIPQICYEEMLEMAASGAKILHLRCVEYARRESVPVHVRSSFTDLPGTWVVDQPDIPQGGAMEAALITGVAHDLSEAKVTVVGVPDQVGMAARVFQVVAAVGINIDMIVQNASIADDTTAITFTMPDADRPRAIEALRAVQEEIGFADIVYDDAIGKVSVVGVGMRSHPGVTARFFTALSEAGVNIGMIATSEIRISVVVDEKDVAKAVAAAHTAFGLDSANGEAVVYAGTGR
jgi:aspartate kinase